MLLLRTAAAAAAAQYAAFVLVELATFKTIALSFVVAAAPIQLVACKKHTLLLNIFLYLSRACLVR